MRCSESGHNSHPLSDKLNDTNFRNVVDVIKDAPVEFLCNTSIFRDLFTTCSQQDNRKIPLELSILQCRSHCFTMTLKWFSF